MAAAAVHQPGRRPARHNVFFALWPDEATRVRIAETVARLRGTAPRGRWIRPQRWHLTLRFMGAVEHPESAWLDALCAAAGRVAIPAFDLALERAGSFGTRRVPCWLGPRETPSELLTLRAALDAELVRAGHATDGDGRPFVPHLTFLSGAEVPFAAELAEPVRWCVAEFVLIDSAIEPPAPYRFLGRWPLG